MKNLVFKGEALNLPPFCPVRQSEETKKFWFKTDICLRNQSCIECIIENIDERVKSA